MIIRALGLGLLLTVAAACMRPSDAPDYHRFSAVATTLHYDSSLTLLERRQVLSDLRVALTQRNTFGRVLEIPPTGKPTGVLLLDLRLLDIKRRANHIDVTAQIDLVDMATGKRFHSFSIGAKGSRNGDLGAMSIGVISDLVEQIADVLSRPIIL
jgi:hypothetical protein